MGACRARVTVDFRLGDLGLGQCGSRASQSPLFLVFGGNLTGRSLLVVIVLAILSRVGSTRRCVARRVSGSMANSGMA